MSLISLFKSKVLFFLFLILLFFGLFILNAIDNDSRIYNEIWNCSHFVVFFILWLFVINIFPWFRPLDLKRVIIIILATLVVSAGIEWLQIKVGRTASWNDIQLSLAGSIVVVAVYIADISKNKLAIVINISLIIVSSIFLSWSTLKIFIDELYIVKQAPILSDFSTPFEKTRWRGSYSILNVSNDRNNTGLLVLLKPGNWYSTVELRHFSKIWNGYQKLVIEVENQETSKFEVSIRVHDKMHRRFRFLYKDRFTQSFILQPGNNILLIDIDSIRYAPESREMDLNKIEAMMLLTNNLKTKKIIKINRVYLK